MVEVTVWVIPYCWGVLHPSGGQATETLVHEPVEGYLPSWARTPEHQMGLQHYTNTLSLSWPCPSHRGRSHFMVLTLATDLLKDRLKEWSSQPPQ